MRLRVVVRVCKCASVSVCASLYVCVRPCLVLRRVCVCANGHLSIRKCASVGGCACVDVYNRQCQFSRVLSCLVLSCLVVRLLVCVRRCTSVCVRVLFCVECVFVRTATCPFISVLLWVGVRVWMGSQSAMPV